MVRGENGALSLAAVNGAAAAAGLSPGMPLADGRAILPDLKTAEWAPGEDTKALARLAEWCCRYTPWSALDRTESNSGAAGLLFDITGCAHLFGGEAALLSDLLAHLGRFGFTAQAGVADTPGAAWAVARFAYRQETSCLVPSGAQRAALAPLPPAALRLSAACVELLDRLGIDRIEQLYHLPPVTLQPRFGAELTRRLRQALGEAPEPLSPLTAVAPYLARRVFAEPLMAREDLARALAVLAVCLARQLEKTQRGARRLELTSYRVDGSLQRLSLGVSRPCREPSRFERLFAEHLDRVDPGFGIEVMALAAPVSEALSAQQLALGPESKGQGPGGDQLAGLVDRLSARLGEASVFRQAPHESHLPERAVQRASALEGAPASGQSQAWVRDKARPLRLFAPPQPIEAVALLPDHPPVRFRWRRLLHQVARAEGPERITPEWWLDDPDRAQEPPRDYFRVEDDEGRRYWLYRADHAWFLHGVFA